MRRRGTAAIRGDSIVGGVALPEGRKPRHQEVLDALLAELASGRLRAGDRLPTESELAEAFSASRSTIARAMRDLKDRGLLLSQRGGGTRVTRKIDRKKESSKRIALFTPWLKTPELLGYVGGQIYAHLSDLASQRGDHLRLQFIRQTTGDCLAPMLAAARALIDHGVQGVFYYPAELPQTIAHYNKRVVDELQNTGVSVIAIDRDIV
ncbi:MAG TPA: GntR family transcriptional regulator, partial [Tepidisphaeraceae bacterium]|nr:GntR family transcriptional regulator [Tepidisphaeraceae bacterium]